ncbi:hypothetical protein M6B38_210980 [Iris pallida]|uniref:Uncharacterized protein n=1 Tax=Iris pallida TaxID=29817 RepID=A0AAX6E3W5_IRIPA|nr:hypothetical protein M6B38_210980 [Iris pallida]
MYRPSIGEESCRILGIGPIWCTETSGWMTRRRGHANDRVKI